MALLKSVLKSHNETLCYREERKPASLPFLYAPAREDGGTQGCQQVGNLCIDNTLEITSDAPTKKQENYVIS